MSVALLLFLMLGISSMFYGFMTAIAQDLPNIDAYKFRPKANGVIFAADGHPLAVLRSDQNRILVPPSRISLVMKHATVAIEDKRFYKHGAIDPLGMMRAAGVDVWTGSASQGGSTITQQFVKNAYTNGSRSVRRKIIEAALAYQVEEHWSKDKILSEYLNTVYFGHRAYGVEAASRVYFGTHAISLEPWQAALLAGMVRGPGEYDPVLYPARARARRNIVLGDMLQQGYIKQVEYQIAVRKPLLPPGHKVRITGEETGPAPYFTQYVTQELVDHFGVARTFGGGLKVYTTLDRRMQAQARAAVIDILKKRKGPSGALVAIDPRTGQVKAMVGGRNWDVKHQFNLATQARRQPGSSFKTFVLLAALREGIQPSTEFNSHPLFIPSASTGGSPWVVSNDTHTYNGTIPLTEATILSDNTVFAQLTLLVGPAAVRAMAHAMGIITPLDALPAIGLGGLHIGVSPLEMAHAYASVANGGVRIGGSTLFRTVAAGESADPSLSPVSILKVTDSNGNVLLDNTPVATRIVDRNDALTVVDMEKPVIRIGTAQQIRSFPRPAAGKTGTTSDFADAWFVGMTPQLVASVWVGYPDAARPMRTQFNGKPVFGGTFPALIWSQFMRRSLAGKPVRDWPAPVPPSSETVMIDRYTHQRVNPGCPPPRATQVVLSIDQVPSTFSNCTGQPVGMPDLTNATEAQAKHLVDRAGLVPRIFHYVPLESERPGTVMYQDPQPAQAVLAGSTVTVGIAKKVVWVSVPQALSMPANRAKSILRASGFTVQTEQTFDPDAVGKVVSETPDGGTRQPRGSAIRLLIGTAQATG